MSFLFCCKEIDRLRERITDLEALKDLQFEELQAANALSADLRQKLAQAEADRDLYRMKANCNGGPW